MRLAGLSAASRRRELGKTNDAIMTFQSLTEDYPELPEPYNNLAVLYSSKGQFEKARVALELAIPDPPQLLDSP